MASQTKSKDAVEAHASQGNSFACMLKQAHSAGTKPAVVGPKKDGASGKTAETQPATSDLIAASASTPVRNAATDNSNSNAADTASDLSATAAPQQTATAADVVPAKHASVKLPNALSGEDILDQDAAAGDSDDTKNVDGKSQLKPHANETKAKASAHRSARIMTDSVAQPAQTEVSATQSLQLVPVATQNVPVAKATEALAKNTGDANSAIAKIAVSKNAILATANATSALPQTTNAPVQQDATKVVATTASGAADHEADEEQGSDDTGSLFADKIASAIGSRHGLLANAEVVTQPAAPAGASFRFSLQDVAHTSHAITHNTVHEAVQASAFANDVTATPENMPAVRHLEVGMNDPILGNVGVRAEMRNGALHASISGAVNDIANAAPALHEYLQQHNVELHSVSFTAPTHNDTRVPQVNAAATTSFSGGMDSSSSNGSGAQPQQQSARTVVPEWKSAFPDDSGYNVNGFTTSRIPAAALSSVRAGSTLSIHI